MDFGWEDLGRLLAACVAGAVIGLERELNDKPAGLRTNIMICLGAAVFTVLSVHIGVGTAHDPGRIAAQVVTGVGFLGAGAIIQYRGHIVGLTTAATIWLVASIGMALGAGAWALGVSATVLTAGVLVGLSLAEERVARWRALARFDIEIDAAPDSAAALRRVVDETGVRCGSWTITKHRDGLTIFAEVTGPTQRVEQLQHTLMHLERVRSLRRL